MPLAHSDQSPVKTTPAAPPALPEGWHHTDELDWDEPDLRARRRRLALVAVVAVLVLAAVVALVVLNAQAHYSRGLAALHARQYERAAAELSGATLYILPYRDASLLADEARSEALVSYTEREDAATRVKDASAALRRASAALQSAGAPAVLSALQRLDAEDLQAATRDDAGVASAVETLAHDVSGAAGQALKKLKWGRAETLAAALVLLDPKSEAAAQIASRAAAGRALSARLAKAQDAARHGEWRKALKLALAVAAARKGFPGAATVVAQARKALKPKPAPKTATKTTTPSTSTGGTSSGTSSGSSSGSSSQPPPP